MNTAPGSATPPHRAIETAHPLGIGTPEDVARAVLYLASDEARGSAGAIVPVDGGVVAWTSPLGVALANRPGRRLRSSAMRRRPSR
jgi:enoyl-ACP reductase-like protein